MVLKAINDKRTHDNQFDYHGAFKDISTGEEKLCIFLAGYKEFLYPVNFSRLERYRVEKMDICIISSELYCIQKNWAKYVQNINGHTYIQRKIIYL